VRANWLATGKGTRPQNRRVLPHSACGEAMLSADMQGERNLRVRQQGPERIKFRRGGRIATGRDAVLNKDRPRPAVDHAFGFSDGAVKWLG
jgi:hypothetical protein